MEIIQQLNEFALTQCFTGAPMSVCTAMSQGYIGYDLQNALAVNGKKRHLQDCQYNSDTGSG